MPIKQRRKISNKGKHNDRTCSNVESSSKDDNNNNNNNLDIIKIIPTSDLLYSRRQSKINNTITTTSTSNNNNENSILTLEAYYSSIQIQRYDKSTKNIILQNVYIGDIIPIQIYDNENDNDIIINNNNTNNINQLNNFTFINREPFINNSSNNNSNNNNKPIKWVIGQVLCIYTILNQLTLETTYHCYIKYFLPFQSNMIQKILLNDNNNNNNNNIIKELKLSGRPQYMLLEQHNIYNIINITKHILPGIIKIDKLGKFIRDNIKAKKIINNYNCYEISFFCKKHIPIVYLNNKLGECNDNDYITTNINTTTTNNNNFIISASVIRGWDSLQRYESELFNNNSKLLNLILKQQTNIKYTIQSIIRFQIQEHKQELNNNDNDFDEVDNNEDTNVDDDDVESMNTEIIHNKKIKNKIEISLPLKKKNIPQKKKIPPKTISNKNNDNNINNNNDNDNNNKRKSSRIETNNIIVSSSKKIKKEENINSTNSRELHEKNTSKHEKCNNKNVSPNDNVNVPIGNIAYCHSMSNSNSNRKPKNINNSNKIDTASTGSPTSSSNNTINLLFYNTANIQTNWDDVCNGIIGLQRKKKSWNINIGDLIAMPCEESRSKQPIYTMSNKSSSLTKPNEKDIWFPFKQNWSPAQILAIYKKEHINDSNICNSTKNQHKKESNDIYVQLRWLYRPNDLKKDSFTKNQLDDLFPKNNNNKEDLSLLYSGRKYIEVDYHISEAYADCILGRIVTKDRCDVNIKNDVLWLNSFVDQDGIPQVPIICSYAFFKHLHSDYKTIALKDMSNNKKNKKKVTQINDWFNYYSATKNGPLYRLLKCPGGYPNKIEQLHYHYDQFLCETYKLNKNKKLVTPTKRSNLSISSNTNTSNTTSSTDTSSHDSISISWPTELLLWHKRKTKQIDIFTDKRSALFHRQDLMNGIKREFFQSHTAQLITRRCDSRATGKKSTNDFKEWIVHVGDIVCVARNNIKCNDNNDSTSTNNMPIKKVNQWYPFIAPWRVCQILNIYCDTTNEDDDASLLKTFIEVRWFYRKSDIPHTIKTWMPQSNTLQEEIYETDKVEDNIPISHILGCADLYLGHFNGISNVRSNDSKDIPAVSSRCRYFYFSQYERFQPLFCSETQSQPWLKQLFERGLRLSSLIDQDKLLTQVIECSYDIELSDDSKSKDFLKLSDAFRGLKSIENETEEVGLKPSQQLILPSDEVKTEFTYYLTTNIVPLWQEFVEPEIICSKSDRKGLRWTIKIGDFVAIKYKESHTNHNLFPFKCEWRPAQVLAIFTGNDTSKCSEIKIQIRWLYRQNDHTILHNSIRSTNLESVYETDDVCSDLFDTESLLGPITLVSGDDLVSVPRAWHAIQPYLPVTFLLYSGSLSTIHGCRIEGSSLGSLLRNGIELSNHYGEKGRYIICVGLKKLLEDSMEMSSFYPLSTQSFIDGTLPFDLVPTGNKSKDAKVEAMSEEEDDFFAWTSVAPFHVDRSAGIEYFNQLDVKPPFSEYVLGKPTSVVPRPVWTVRIGDVVVLKCDGSPAKAAYGKSSTQYTRGGANWPFKGTWAVGEVVTIMKPITKRELWDKSTNEVDKVDESDISFEIRWVYRPCEMKGMKSRLSDPSDIYSEEIFETDEYDEVHAACLLSPVDLHENPIEVTNLKSRFGMPVIDFFCKRFFSIHRKSLMPFAGLGGRVTRGRANSPRIGNDVALKASLNRAFNEDQASKYKEPIKSNISTKFTSWDNAFRDVIAKLSLTDASKEAYDNKTMLIGREKERKEILSFLRSSIKGTITEDNRPSIFIAGPPGVGKTASIRAAICELKHEQSAGTIQEFDFVSLNGMEMRHPYESYVKLWEEIGGGDKPTLSAELASMHLKEYFIGKKSCNEGEKNRVVVVLIDEIDYLVTKKQTVLYDFFDWPLLSLEVGSKRRIITIGISNTLNLPERLHTRIQSRMGNKRIFFQSYNVDQSASILKAKIQQASPNYTVFTDEAILFAAKKTAALSGDIRKGFHICRTAADMVLNESHAKDETTSFMPVVRIKDVLKVSKEASNTAHSRTVALCQHFEVLLLLSLTVLAKSTGREFGGFGVEEITAKMHFIANEFGNTGYTPAPNIMETLTILSRLGEADIVQTTTPRNTSMSYRASTGGSGGAWPIVRINIDEHVFLQSLKGTDHYEIAQKYLVNSF